MQLMILERALNGWHSHGVVRDGKVSRTYYMDGEPERVIQDDDDLTDGCVVIDKGEVPDIVKRVCRAPLLDCTLKPDAVRLLGEVEQKKMAAMNLYGAMGAVARGYLMSLDSVGLNGYIAYWREAGAKIGRVENGSVVWE